MRKHPALPVVGALAWFLCLLSVTAQKVGRLWAKQRRKNREDPSAVPQDDRGGIPLTLTTVLH